MAINMRARRPYGDRWPTKAEFMHDSLTSAPSIGFAALFLGFGLGITMTLYALGMGGAWKPGVFALVLVALLLGGIRFVLEAYYEQEIRPRSEENERLYGGAR